MATNGTDCGSLGIVSPLVGSEARLVLALRYGHFMHLRYYTMARGVWPMADYIKEGKRQARATRYVHYLHLFMLRVQCSVSNIAVMEHYVHLCSCYVNTNSL